MASLAQYSFSGGEWSPFVTERVDLSRYSSACLTMENMILSFNGTARRRPGTEYVAEAKYAARECRLLKFQFSVTTSFVLELGHLYMRFFSNGVQVTSGGSPYEIVSPYSEDELRDVHVAQVNNEMRFVHPDHPPYILRRVTDTNWTFAEIAYTQPALRDENLDETQTITPSATTGTGITLTANGFTFDETNIGGYYRIGYARTIADSEIAIGAATNNTGSTPLRVKGDWEIFTGGSWTGTVSLQRRKGGGAWETIRVWSSAEDRNISATGTELEDDVDYRVFFSNHQPGGGRTNPRAVLEVTNSETYGIVKTTAVASGGATATADVIVTLDQTASTFRWSEGAWSVPRGYPRSLTLHQSRMYFGGNEAQAQTIWASDVDGYDRFTEEDLQDSDSFRVTLGSLEYNGIQWLSSSPKNLLIGTVGGEWTLSSGEESNILTVTSVRAKPESELGSAHLQPVTANTVVLFTQKGARDVSEIVYSFEQDGFINAKLTELSEHVTKGGIKEIAYQKQRDPILWCVTGDGILAGLTYSRKQEVVGWHRHTTQGSFESVAVITTALEEDEVWFSVKRNINGADTRYIERFYPDMLRTQDNAADARDLMYVDSGAKFTGTALTSVSVPHLYTETVSVLEEGATTPDQAVAYDGTVTTVDPSDTVIAGLPFTSTLEPTYLEVPLQDGTSQGREKRMHKVITSVYKTGPFKVGNASKTDTVYTRDTSDPMDAAPPLLTKKVDKAVPSLWQKNLSVRIVQDLPLPLTVLGLVRNYRIEGNA